MSFGPFVFTDQVRAELRKHYEAAVDANDDPLVAQRLERIAVSLEYVDRLMGYASLKRSAESETDTGKALSRAEEALEAGERLLEEIRQDREKWGGVVSTSVAGSRHYLGKDVSRWGEQVREMRDAAN